MSTSSLLLELTEGSSSLVPSALSITPISSAAGSNSSPNFSSVLGGMGLDRRPVINSLPSSITITPITPSQAKSMDERHRSEKKSSSSGKSSRSSSSDRFKEKKKKKRREDSMGPPGKLPHKDSLSKPLSSSIKPSDGSHSPLTIRSSSPNTLIRKFSPSPTHGRSMSSSKISSTGSPGSIKSMGKPSGSSSHHNSPRHSPVQCSPKHTLSGYSSPKNHGTSSPKHSSSSTSTGKPSMSTLKSATSGSPSGKSSSSGYELSKLSKISSGKEGSSSSRDKERKSSSGLSYSSSGSGSPKLKSSSVKLKQLDLSASSHDNQSSNMNSESSISPGLDLSKSATSNQLRNRKGSLSAIVDKLKSAQHCGTEIELTSNKSSSSGNSSSKERTGTSSNKMSDSKSNLSSSSSKLCDSNKTQEYMVKPSSDGMKITINKTRTKDSSSGSITSKSSFSSSSSSAFSSSSSNKQSSSAQPTSNTGSPKTHTGLKPGVISGPASKKPQVLQSTKSVPNTNASGGSSGSPKTSSLSNIGSNAKVAFMKSSSSSNLSSGSSAQKISSKTSTGSPKMSGSSDPSKMNRDKDKIRTIKSSSTSSGSSEKSIFASSKSGERRLSPAPSRDDIDGDKSLKSLTKDPNFTVEGLIKSLDTSKYQIPKLSARISSDDANKAKNSPSTEKSTSQTSSLQSDLSNMQNRTPLNESAPKLLEYVGRQQDMLSSKFSFQHLANSKLSEQLQKQQPPVSKPALNLSGSSPKLQTNPMSLTSPKSSENLETFQPANLSFKSQTEQKSDTKLFDRLNPINASRPDDVKMDFSKNFSSLAPCNAEKQTDKTSFSSQKKSPSDKFSHDLSMKPPQSIPKHQDSSEGLLDFSSSTGLKGNMDMKNKSSNPSVKRHTPPLAAPAQIPSLSVHIVKSPAQSPLIIPSPHSNSPCITDDELMDEAVVGPGK